MTSRFPDPRYARGDVVAIGDDLRVETLRDAYRHGIFPWPHEELTLPWFSPRRRTVIFFDELHVGRSLRKSQKRSGFTYSIDRAFEQVIASCAASPRGEDEGTWIGPEMIAAYTTFHRAGDAHSVEVWRDGELVGGLYGVDSGGVFTGESMFHRVADASKLALLLLIEHLRQRGATWIDCQVTTPHMTALGAREISRNRFLDMLAEQQARGLSLF
ncbi:MAG TPA: leucyl/phenylalanyl-tRNA--protein transferase [Thermoanaerobaculia bacterium]|nr:leucyl/phenylalanyl-tRNA--protein transferase [Thermoanaerobaculia bacterium]